MSPTSPRASLTRLADTLGVAVDAPLDRFCTDFDSYLGHFCELGVQLQPASLALVTLGCGQAFGRRVARFLADTGLFDRDLTDDVLSLQRDIDDWMLVRLLAAPDRDTDVGLYFRRAMTVTDAVTWLAARGVNEAEQQALGHLGALIGSNRTGIFAARIRPNEPILFKVYLHAFFDDGAPVGRALVPVFEQFHVSDPARWRPFLAGLDGLDRSATSEVFLSLLLGDGDAFDSLKVDVFQVDLVAFEQLLLRTGLLAPGSPTPSALAQELGLNTAEHLGLRFDAEGCHLTCYFAAAPG